MVCTLAEANLSDSQTTLFIVSFQASVMAVCAYNILVDGREIAKEDGIVTHTSKVTVGFAIEQIISNRKDCNLRTAPSFPLRYIN